MTQLKSMVRIGPVIWTALLISIAFSGFSGAPQCNDREAMNQMTDDFTIKLADEYRGKYPKLSYKENLDLAAQIDKRIENIATKSIDAKQKQTSCKATVWIMEVPFRKRNIEYNVRYGNDGKVELEITNYNEMFY